MLRPLFFFLAVVASSALAFLQGSAEAATQSATVEAGRTATVRGEFTGPGVIISPGDPALGCPSDASNPPDPITGTRLVNCKYVKAHVTGSGKVKATLSFAEGELLDFSVHDATGATVATALCCDPSGTTTTAEFDAVQGATFEIRISSFDLNLALGPVPFTLSLTLTTPGGIGGASGDTCGDQPDDFERDVEGGGKAYGTPYNVHFSLEFDDDESKLKLSDHDRQVKFRLKDVTSRVCNDADKSVTVTGTGVNYIPERHEVTFTLHVKDNGRGESDYFEVHLSDGYNRAGTLAYGDIKYMIEED